MSDQEGDFKQGRFKPAYVVGGLAVVGMVGTFGGIFVPFR